MTAYPGRPRLLLVKVRYANDGSALVEVRGYASHRYAFEPSVGGQEPAFWSYQPASYESRPDWVLPVKAGFAQENFLGMNASDYGGGTPVVDVWRRDVGLAVGHVEVVPKLVSLPVRRKGAGDVEVSLVAKKDARLGPGEALTTLIPAVAPAVVLPDGVQLLPAPAREDALNPGLVRSQPAQRSTELLGVAEGPARLSGQQPS